MKSKGKRNNNRPATFREKSRNAFAGALKGLAGVNSAKKEDVIASFDLDKRSVERRIDAMEKNRAVAKRIAEGCIKGDPSFNFDDEWIAINILMDPPYNVGEERCSAILWQRLSGFSTRFGQIRRWMRRWRSFRKTKINWIPYAYRNAFRRATARQCCGAWYTPSCTGTRTVLDL